MSRHTADPASDAPTVTQDAPAAATPRIDRVQAARARIRTHYYDQPEVQDALIEALLRELAP